MLSGFMDDNFTTMHWDPIGCIWTPAYVRAWVAFSNGKMCQASSRICLLFEIHNWWVIFNIHNVHAGPLSFSLLYEKLDNTN